MPVNHEPAKPAPALEIAKAVAVMLGFVILGIMFLPWGT